MTNKLITTYRSDIDGLRAFAVLSVLAFHAFPNWLPGGFIGVDVFFVISGFLISSILFTHLENNTFSFIDFYQRRIKRIFPALFFILFFCIVFGWFALFPEEYKQLGRHVASGAGFIANFTLWRESGYFDSVADTKPLLHLWSLGIEEQFYIIWPLLLWMAWKKQLNVLKIIVILAAISFLINIFFINKHMEAIFYMPYSRFWELLCGSFLAWLSIHKLPAPGYQNLNYQQPLRQHLFSFLGFILLLIALIVFSKQTTFPGAYALVPVLGTALIIWAGPFTWFNKKILSHPILVWFGLISFPLYLWHWPLLSFACIINNDTPSVLSRVIILICSIILAWLTYHLLEKPIRWNDKANKTKLIILISCMIGIACFGFYIKKHEGLNTRFKNSQQLSALRDIAPNSKKADIPCQKVLPQFKQFKFEGACIMNKDKMPDILFLGDSHALHYVHAIKELFQNHSILLISEPSCLPFSSNKFLKDECKKKYTAILSFLEKNTSIKKIYVSGYWAYLMTGGFAKNGINWRLAQPVNNQVNSFLSNGKYFFNTILSSKKEIVFLKDIPDLDFNINYCYISRPLTLPFSQTTRKKCWLDFAEYEKRTKQYDLVLEQLLADFPQIQVYDPRPLFCNTKRCIVKDDKFPYYINGDHLNNYGATWVLNDLLKKIELKQPIA